MSRGNEPEIISIEDVDEAQLNKHRLLSLRDPDTSGIRAGEKLYHAEFRLLEAARNCLELGGSKALIQRIIDEAIEGHEST